ncbi:hypothetical protein N7462_010127 [Penicillium macrosclerotiorum]|uniref:uncharacterized protein n=1 Tax=Penicillium macrosclerotiorum TaxID=303699 RepID=UPI002548ED4E|nr:uncharacterized protein N7462_010127 [Penicillium macrosclerotiorum]KAJ5669057.1 hypothetical protein N7462_010127 [Penicillium macrosclerotiorum]
MAESQNENSVMFALEHYQLALELFIQHLATPAVESWIIFPSLWLFILYEQTYGDDPKILQAHLRGVRDVIATHGTKVLSWSIDERKISEQESGENYIPSQMINKMAVWTIHYDAKASTFGLDGGIIDLLNQKFPGSMQRLCESSKHALKNAWGPAYPAFEEVWDMQVDDLWMLNHETTMLRFELSILERKRGKIVSSEKINFGKKLRIIEKRFSNYASIALSKQRERSDLVSNICSLVADLYALIVRYDRITYHIQSSALSPLLKVCAYLYEYEGSSFLWHIAWPLFVASFETDDPIHQSWIIDRFEQMEKTGKNMRRAKIMLKELFKTKRDMSQPVDYYLDWIVDSKFEQFSI